MLSQIIQLGGYTEPWASTVTFAILVQSEMDCWCLSYAEKPDENSEDPQDVQAIREAKENIGDLKLKSDKDFTVPKELRMNAEKKEAQLICLEENVCKHTNMHMSWYTSEI